tara:strand:+ start:1175 stop:1363 length:189 start_codon:yes stop_codon:yes gene_type:complete
MQMQSSIPVFVFLPVPVSQVPEFSGFFGEFDEQEWVAGDQRCRGEEGEMNHKSQPAAGCRGD